MKMKLAPKIRLILWHMLDGILIGLALGLLLGGLGGVAFLLLIYLTLDPLTSALPRGLSEFVLYGMVIGLPMGGLLGAAGGALVGILRPNTKRYKKRVGY